LIDIALPVDSKVSDNKNQEKVG